MFFAEKKKTQANNKIIYIQKFKRILWTLDPKQLKQVSGSVPLTTYFIETTFRSGGNP